jgi:hypothetical protein
MMVQVLQISALVGIALYFVRWYKNVKRRNSQTWETLMARLRSEWSARELSDHFLWQEGLSATPEDSWQRMEGPKGLWVMYQNARVMQEMANYAAKHCEGVDRLLIETIHSDALQIRVCVVAALGQYAFSRASEGVRINAFRAAALYTGMAARTMQMLQEHAGGMVPSFAASM